MGVVGAALPCYDDALAAIVTGSVTDTQRHTT
jgi:hypothetical protein